MDAEFKRFRIDQAAEYLGSIRDKAVRIKAIKTSIQEMREIAGIHGVDYSRENISATSDDGAMLRAVTRLDALIKEREDLLEEYRKAAQHAVRAIERMSNIECMSALEMHYIGGVDWKDIAASMGYSKSGIMAIRKRALNEFYDVMPPRQKTEIPEAI